MKMINTRKFDGHTPADLLEQVKKLQQIIGEITDLCMEEIESKGRFGANQKILDIMELIDE